MLQAAMVTCQPDLQSLCASATDLKTQVVCLAQHQSDLSPQCKTELWDAIRAYKQQEAAQSGGAGTPSEDVQMQQLKQCMPGITRTCQPQVVELMTNPLTADASALVECAKAHSSTIGGACEDIVEKITRDGLFEDLVSCGQDFLGLCPRESLVLMAAEVNNQVKLQALRPFVQCLMRNKDQISSTCEIISEALEADEEEEDPDWKKGGDGASGTGYGYGASGGYADGGDWHGHGHGHGRGNHKGGGGAIAAATIMGLCVCCMFAGVAVWKREEIGGMMGGRSHPNIHSGMQFHSLNDDDVEARAGLTQPGYAEVAHAKIVTATPIA